MTDTLLTIEPYELEDGRTYTDGEIAAESQAHIERKTLERVGETAAERKTREKAEAELAKLEQARQAKIEGFNQVNGLWSDYQRALENEQRAKEHVAGAQATIADAKELIELRGFEGHHPQLGRSVPAHYSVEVGVNVAGARFVIDEVYPEWTKKNAARIADLKAQIIELATKLNIAHELPKGFIDGK